MSKVVLVVAAHTDDEALGCGGTLARHAAEGDIVHAVFMADGVTSRQNRVADDSALRHEAAEKARQIIGISKNYYLCMPDNRLDSVLFLDVVQQLEPIIELLNPEIIYTHHVGDLNIDHQITHRAVVTACRPTPGHSVKEIYAFEVMSSTEWASSSLAPFMPNHFVDISKFLNVKMASIDAYALEMRDAPHSRSLLHIDSLAKHRGFSVGFQAAEAFMLVRALR